MAVYGLIVFDASPLITLAKAGVAYTSCPLAAIITA
jgi:hypothetical protein